MSAAAGSALSGALTIPAVAATGAISGTTTLTVSSLTAGNLGPGSSVTVNGTSCGTVVSQLTGTPGGNGTYQMTLSPTASGALTGVSAVARGQVSNSLTALLNTAMRGIW